MLFRRLSIYSQICFTYVLCLPKTQNKEETQLEEKETIIEETQAEEKETIIEETQATKRWWHFFK